MNVAYIITSRRHVAEYEVGFLSCLHFAKRIVCIVRLF